MSEGNAAETRRKAISGLGWTLSSNMTVRVLQFFIGIVMANLLLPEHYGVIAMVVVFSGVATILQSFGFAGALLYHKHVGEEHFQSVFWFMVVMSVGLYGALYAAAPLIADIYGEPSIIKPARLLMLLVIVHALEAVPATILYKRMAFRAHAVTRFCALILSATVAITLAVKGYGVYALIWELLISVSTVTVGIFITIRWRPRLIFRLHCLKELLRFSLNSVGSALLLHFSQNIDNFLAARYLGKTPVGLYSKAFACMRLPEAVLVGSVCQVMAPMLTEMQDDLAAVRTYFLRLLALTYMLVTPPMLMLGVVSHDFTMALLGEKWLDMVPLLQVMTVIGVIRIFLKLTEQLVLTQTRSDYMLIMNILKVVFNSLGIVIGLQFGLLGICLGLLISDLVLFVPFGYLVVRQIQVRARSMVAVVLPVILCSLGMVAAMLAVQSALPASWPLPAVELPELVIRRWPHLVNMGITCAVGGVTVLALLAGFRVSIFRTVLRIVSERRASKSAIRDALREDAE